MKLRAEVREERDRVMGTLIVWKDDGFGEYLALRFTGSAEVVREVAARINAGEAAVV